MFENVFLKGNSQKQWVSWWVIFEGVDVQTRCPAGQLNYTLLYNCVYALNR